jgi:hypothetical protein
MQNSSPGVDLNISESPKKQASLKGVSSAVYIHLNLKAQNRFLRISTDEDESMPVASRRDDTDESTSPKRQISLKDITRSIKNASIPGTSSRIEISNEDELFKPAASPRVKPAINKPVNTTPNMRNSLKDTCISKSQNQFDFPSSSDDENAGVLVFDGTPIKPIKKTNPIDIWTPAKNFDTPVKSTTPSTPSTPYKKIDRQFVKNRERLAREFYTAFNARVFSKQLPSDLQIDWSVTLNKTAGRCYTKRTIHDGQVGYQARIELSTKVVDDVEKLKSTVRMEFI